MEKLALLFLTLIALTLPACSTNDVCTASIIVTGQADREAALKRINDELVKMQFTLKKPPIGANQWLIYSMGEFVGGVGYTVGILVTDKSPNITVSFGVTSEKFTPDSITLYQKIVQTLQTVFGAANVTAETKNSCGQSLI